MINTILLIVVIFILAFQFVVILNVIKKMLEYIQSNIHEFAKEEIYRIINDKELFDSIKNYAGGVIQGALAKSTPRGGNSLMNGILGLLMNRFMPINQENKESSSSNENNNSRAISKANPFTK